MGISPQVITPLNGVTATTTSSLISLEGVRKVTWFFTRADHDAGSSTFTVTVSANNTTWYAYSKLISNVTNTNAQTPTRVASVALSSNTTEMYSMDLTDDAFKSMKVTATEATDGTHTAICCLEYY